MTSTHTSKTTTAKLQADINAAATAHAAALAAITTAEDEHSTAVTALADIEKCIAAGDPRAGLEDLMKADSAKRFHELAAIGKTNAARVTDVALRDAKSALLISDIENDGRIVLDDVNERGLALAKEIAPMVTAFRELYTKHNEARLEAIERASETSAHDAVNGWGSTLSRIVFGKQHLNQNARRSEPEFIELDDQPIKFLPEHMAVDDLLKSIKALVEYTPEDLAGTPGLVPFNPEYAGPAYHDPRS